MSFIATSVGILETNLTDWSGRAHNRDMTTTQTLRRTAKTKATEICAMRLRVNCRKAGRPLNVEDAWNAIAEIQGQRTDVASIPLSGQRVLVAARKMS